MDRLFASLIVASLLSGCELFMPVTADEAIGQDGLYSYGAMVGGYCRYDNGGVVVSPEASTCN